MLHVLVKTNDFGLRKAWFIAACDGYAIIAFKNNDNARQFTTTEFCNIFLDTSFKNESHPVIESLRDVNTALKKRNKKT